MDTSQQWKKAKCICGPQRFTTIEENLVKLETCIIFYTSQLGLTKISAGSMENGIMRITNNRRLITAPGQSTEINKRKIKMLVSTLRTIVLMNVTTREIKNCDKMIVIDLVFMKIFDINNRKDTDDRKIFRLT